MNKILIIVITGLVLSLSGFLISAEAEQNQIKCGIIVTHMAVSPSGILEGLRPLAKYMTKNLGIPVKVELVPDSANMIQRLNNGDLQLGYVSNLDYVKIKNSVNVTPFAKVVKGGSSTYNAVLLVRKDSGINSIDQLKGKKFAFTSKNSSHGYLFPSMLIQSKFKMPLDKFFSEIIKTKKDPDGIFSVLYKKSDAVAASSQTFAIMCLLMPRLKRELKIIDQSEPLVHGPMFYYSKNFTDKNLIEKTKKEVLDMKKSPEGKQVLLLFRVGGWNTASDADYNNLRQLDKKY